MTTGGELGAWIVEKHLARFLEGRGHRHREDLGPDVLLDALLRPQGHRRSTRSAASTSRCGICSGRCGRSRSTTCSAARCATSCIFYATGARPDLAKEMGFIGGKMPLQHGPAEGEEGLRQEHRRSSRDMRERVGDDFWLMFDCWMSLDLDYATRLAHRGRRVRPQVDRGGADPRRLLGLRRAAAAGAPQHAGHHRRARGDPLGLPHAARDGLLRHPPARRRLVRRHHRAASRSRRSPTRTASWSCRTDRACTRTTS